MITSLTLRNWRTHKDTTLEFGLGTNVIVGVMGSGKSSIVNGISYSLFGTFPSLKSKSVSLKEIIMNKPNQTERAETSLTFEHNSKKFRVERVIKADGTNEAKLFEAEGNRLVAGPKQKDVNERIEKELGLSYELFSRAVYAEQNELDFFLKLSPGERKKKFDELLELEKYETARKNSISLQNQMVKENKLKKDFITQQKETIKAHEEEKLLKQIEEEEKAILILGEELEKAKKDTVIEEEKYKSLFEKEKKHREYEDSLTRSASRADVLRESIERDDKISLEEVKAALELAKKEHAGIQAALEKAEKEFKEKDTEAKKYSEEIKVLEYRKKEILNEEKGISSLKGNCPTCKQALDEKHKEHLTQHYAVELRKIEEELFGKNGERHKLSDIIAGVEKEKNELRKKGEEISRNTYKLEALERQAKELDEKKKQLAALAQELPKIKKKLEELGFDKKELDKTRDQYFSKKSSLDIISNKIKSKQELAKSYHATLEKVEQIRKTIKNLEETIIQIDEAAKKLGMFENCLIATQIELREALLSTINEAMGMIWTEIYPYKDFVNARLLVVEDGYDLQVLTRGGEWVRVEGILSGGERSAAALCIRIAFALVLTKNLSMLILDEPTHNLDTNAVAKLSEMLRERLPKLVSQIFIITHDKQLETAASSNLYLLTRNKDLDEATSAESIEA
ncbi:MAG: SMC family ATPase [archaeon]|mgnify:CR=1 FL=1